MASPFAAALAGLNRAVQGTFGAGIFLIDANGVRTGPISADWRQDPVIIDQGGQGAVSTFQPVLGLDLNDWPPGVSLPDTDWSVEIPTSSATLDCPAGTWEIADTAKPGGAWLDLFLTNFRKP